MYENQTTVQDLAWHKSVAALLKVVIAIQKVHPHLVNCGSGLMNNLLILILVMLEDYTSQDHSGI